MRDKIILDVDPHLGWIDNFTHEELGVIFKSIFLREKGIDYKTGNEKLDQVIRVYNKLYVGCNKPNKEHWLYLFKISINGFEFLKIGISQSVSGRKESFELQGFVCELLFSKSFSTKSLASKNEKKVLAKFSNYRFSHSAKFGGFTECIYVSAVDNVLAYLKTEYNG